MKSSSRLLQVLMIVTALVLPCGSAIADDGAVAGQGEINNALIEKSVLLWARVNQARVNPRQTIERLGISEEVARAALAEDGWILDQGLPPLALSGQLWLSATAHGRDMVDNLYYSEVSPTGSTLAERVAATGYQALQEREALSALVFENLVPLDEAVEAMVDTMLRDELTMGAGVRRNIYSPAVTEAGIGLLAESVTLLEGQPYLYLMVIDFAQPVVPQPVAIGRVEGAASVARLMVKNRYTGFWSMLDLLPGATFQFALSGAGEDVLAFDAENNILGSVDTQACVPDRNCSIDLLLAN